MKVLDLESIERYDFMANSLAFVAIGDLQEAVLSALTHLNNDAKSDKARLDISLYIAKLYSKMGEMDASINLLFRLLRYRIEEGRIFALLAYDFYLIGDNVCGNYYNALTSSWNAKHNYILYIDKEYVHEIVTTQETPKRPIETDDDKALSRAWSYAFGGETDRARSEMDSISNTMLGKKYCLALSLDIADKRNSEIESILWNKIISSSLKNVDIMNIVYLLEVRGDYRRITELMEKVASDGIMTARLEYIYAVALYKIGQRELSLKVITRLAKVFGIIYPYMVTSKYFMQRKDDYDISIYKSNSGLYRDSEVVRIVLSTDIDKWIYNNTAVQMVRDMYIDGVKTDALSYVTSALLVDRRGRELLKDILLDNSVKTAKMRIYIARRLIDGESHLMTVYENIFNECDFILPKGTKKSEIANLKDKCVISLVSGTNI